MKCKECEVAGLTSKVYPGFSSTILMASSPYYDEKGEYHANDPNKTTTHYSCSNGHKWAETS